MMFSAFAAVFLWSFLPPMVHADVVNTKLNFPIPNHVFKQGGYEHREALFGFPYYRYGGAITQNVYYADNSLCDDNVDPTKGFPEREGPWPSPFILMVDRGECTFVQKVRRAQKFGASGVLIADNICQCSDTDCTDQNLSTPCEPKEPIMADDGSGGDITIPSFLMTKHDSDYVKALFGQNQLIQAEMAWDLPAPDDRVEYDLWTTPTDSFSDDFVQNFRPLAVALGDRAQFTPHTYIIDGVTLNCNSGTTPNFCYNLCTNFGRYCAHVPDNIVEEEFSGVDVVKESLRRLCIWSLYGEDGVGTQWWDYVSHFNTHCKEAAYFKDEACIKDGYNVAKISGSEVEACMDDSGGLRDKENAKLEYEIYWQKNRGIVVIPTSNVNTYPIRGALSANNVFKAICSAYAEGSAPAVCERCALCSDPLACVEGGTTCASGSIVANPDSVSKHTFASSILFVICLFSGLGAWRYKSCQKQTRDQSRILAEYMPLEDQDGAGGMDASASPMDFAQGGNSTSLNVVRRRAALQESHESAE